MNILYYHILLVICGSGMYFYFFIFTAFERRCSGHVATRNFLLFRRKVKAGHCNPLLTHTLTETDTPTHTAAATTKSFLIKFNVLYPIRWAGCLCCDYSLLVMLTFYISLKRIFLNTMLFFCCFCFFLFLLSPTHTH